MFAAPPQLAIPSPIVSSPAIVPSRQDIQLVPYGVEIPNRVFVGGCPYNMTDKELADFFCQFGPIKDSKIIFDRATGKSLGYGFVTYVCEADAINVYSSGSIYYNEKKLNVSRAVRKHGGQYGRPNQEYVNGNQVYMHPGGYLLSQYDGGWHYQPTSPHTQPAKPCYALYVNPGVQPPPSNPYALQSPTFGPMGPAYLPSYTPPHFTNPTLPHSVTTHSITPITTPIVSTVFQPGVQQIITSKPVTETQPSTEAALLVSEIEADVSNDQDTSGAPEKESVEDIDSELKSLSLDDSAYTSEDRSRSNSGDSSAGSEEPRPVNLDNIFVKRLSPQQRKKSNIRRRNHSFKNNYTQPILSPPPYHPPQSVGLLPYPAPNYPPGGYIQW